MIPVKQEHPLLPENAEEFWNGSCPQYSSYYISILEDAEQIAFEYFGQEEPQIAHLRRPNAIHIPCIQILILTNLRNPIE